MKIIISFVLFLFVAFSVNAEYSIWPYPQKVHTEQTFFEIRPLNFRFEIKTKDKEHCSIINVAADTYHQSMFVQSCIRLGVSGEPFFSERHNYDLHPDYRGKLVNLTIQINEKCEEWPHVDMDESYNITINEKESVLQSNSVWGALRGLETFSQMVTNTGKDQFTINLGYINDYPRFAHRGVLLDSSRHYLSVKSIKQTLDAMQYNKFNVFHWHIVDDQSFPFVSEMFPELSQKGAYNPTTHVYDQSTVHDIIDYARYRGIRVIAEFDTPGHTRSWGKGQPGLLTECYSNGKANGNYGPIDPTKNANYDFIRKLFFEIVKVFPDNYTHLGGDEVDFGCWKSNPVIQTFMKQMKFNEDYAKLEGYYIQKLVDIVRDLKKSYIVWQEVFDNGVQIKNDTIVHVWKGVPTWDEELKKVTSSGHQALFSTCWYLDYISYGTDWFKYYQCEPTNFNGTKEEKSLILGGEACMWDEYVDSSNVISRVWPRASAVAERLWSDENLKDANKAKGRFHAQHCRMQMLGIRAEPIEGPGFCQCDHAM